mmetsp:Transcript_56834/g.158287  ORF Transcript_56834/g.158287 Transcript_56834/m.158287 type:complete len:243 (-) Transcript_56834:52-780(-)
MYDEDGRDWGPEPRAWDDRTNEENVVAPPQEKENEGPQPVNLPGLGLPMLLWQTGSVAGSVWASGGVLLDRVASEPALLSGKRILELGSGTGYVGLACDRLLSRSDSNCGHRITLTDLPHAVPLLLKNIKLNCSSHVEASPLAWGTADVDAFAAQFDVVIMADVAYRPDLIQPLAATLHAICGPETTVLHAWRDRIGFMHFKPMFFDQLTELGFAHELVCSRGDCELWRHCPLRGTPAATLA